MEYIGESNQLIGAGVSSMTWQLTSELEIDIITWLEAGKGLRAYCLQDNVPSRSTIINWQNTNESFYTKCARAREAAGELAAEDLDEINDLLLSGQLDPAAARVISSNKQWKASKLASKTYGDKTKHEHGGVDGKPIESNVTVRYVDSNEGKDK